MINCIKLCAKFQDHGLDEWYNKNYYRDTSECIFSNLLSEYFSSAVPGWLGLREPDTR